MLIRNLIYGLIIGLGFIIPGVSGGVLATILGIYDKIITKLLNFNKDFKNNFAYLCPIIIGIFLSVLFFSKIILYLLNNHLEFISYVFIGLIIGCPPYLFHEIKIKTNKSIAIIPFFLTFTFGIILFIIENNSLNTTFTPNVLTMFLAGILYSIGKLVPGISGAALLMLIGVYEYFLQIIANPLSINLSIILYFIPFFIAFIISSIFILKIINYLLTQHFRITYSAIIGFVISSILFIYPNIFNFQSLIIAVCAFLISYYLSKKS